MYVYIYICISLFARPSGHPYIMFGRNVGIEDWISIVSPTDRITKKNLHIHFLNPKPFWVNHEQVVVAGLLGRRVWGFLRLRIQDCILGFGA